MVLIAVGTRPNMRLARDAGLACGNGITVNEYGQTTDPDIYAGGDCAATQYIQAGYKEPLYVPLGSTANKVGRIIAHHIAGIEAPFGGISCSGIVKAFEFTLGRTGLSEHQVKSMGIDYITGVCAGPDRPHYMPGAQQIIIKMIAGKSDRKLLGVQIAGKGDASKRLDVAATVIRFEGTLEELTDIDFGYAPPYAPPIDPLAVAAHLLINKLDGIANGISAQEALRRIEGGNVTVLDVRSPDEIRESRLPFDTVTIPLGAVRTRFEELPRDREIITLCKVSMRGYEAQRILNAEGFEKVSFIEGGIAAWPYGLTSG
jgi:rhodanese-related sulfurtransferase